MTRKNKKYQLLISTLLLCFLQMAGIDVYAQAPVTPVQKDTTITHREPPKARARRHRDPMQEQDSLRKDSIVLPPKHLQSIDSLSAAKIQVADSLDAANKKELKNIHKISFLFVGISSILLTTAAITLSTPIVTIFTHDAETFRLAAPGFRIFAVNFLFSGLNITSSGFFTALSNGLVSAIISFCRTLVFIVLCLLILPSFLDLNGAWIAIPVAEFLTLILSAAMHIRYFFRPGKQNYL